MTAPLRFRSLSATPTRPEPDSGRSGTGASAPPGAHTRYHALSLSVPVSLSRCSGPTHLSLSPAHLEQLPQDCRLGCAGWRHGSLPAAVPLRPDPRQPQCRQRRRCGRRQSMTRNLFVSLEAACASAVLRPHLKSAPDASARIRLPQRWWRTSSAAASAPRASPRAALSLTPPPALRRAGPGSAPPATSRSRTRPIATTTARRSGRTSTPTTLGRFSAWWTGGVRLGQANHSRQREQERALVTCRDHWARGAEPQLVLSSAPRPPPSRSTGDVAFLKHTTPLTNLSTALQSNYRLFCPNTPSGAIGCPRAHSGPCIPGVDTLRGMSCAGG